METNEEIYEAAVIQLNRYQKRGWLKFISVIVLMAALVSGIFALQAFIYDTMVVFDKTEIDHE